MGAADVVVTVNQGGVMSFELTIDPKSITANSCAMQIVPSNESETYLCAFMTKKYVDSFDSEEEFIEADLEMVKEQAESKGGYLAAGAAAFQSVVGQVVSGATVSRVSSPFWFACSALWPHP